MILIINIWYDIWCMFVLYIIHTVYCIHVYTYIYIFVFHILILPVFVYISHLLLCWSEISILLGQAGPEPGREIKSMIENEVCELSHIYTASSSLACVPYPEMWRPFLAQANVWECRPLNFEEILGCLAPGLHDGQVAAGGVSSGGSWSMVRKMIYKLGIWHWSFDA